MVATQKPRGEVISKSEAARRLGVNRQVIGPLIAGNKIPLFPRITGGTSEGIDENGMKRLIPLVEAYLASIAASA